MGRAPCCDKANVKKGPWSPEEDAKLKEYMHRFGIGRNWIELPKKAGLKRCGKSCRLRWLNYLRPNIKHGDFSEDEDKIIFTLFASIGSRWSIIASHLPGRTDNDIKNYWNTKLKKKLFGNTTKKAKSNQHQLLPSSSPSPAYHQYFPSAFPEYYQNKWNNNDNNLHIFGPGQMNNTCSEINFGGGMHTMELPSSCESFSLFGGMGDEQQKLLLGEISGVEGDYERIKQVINPNYGFDDQKGAILEGRWSSFKAQERLMSYY